MGSNVVNPKVKDVIKNTINAITEKKQLTVKELCRLKMDVAKVVNPMVKGSAQYAYNCIEWIRYVPIRSQIEWVSNKKYHFAMALERL
jgi:hypothetical protein